MSQFVETKYPCAINDCRKPSMHRVDGKEMCFKHYELWRQEVNADGGNVDKPEEKRKDYWCKGCENHYPYSQMVGGYCRLCDNKLQEARDARTKSLGQCQWKEDFAGCAAKATVEYCFNGKFFSLCKSHTDYAKSLAALPVQMCEQKPEAADLVNHPSHYKSHPSGVECIQITEHMSFTLGNAMKYIWRADEKNGVEDLRKAVWYLQREIEKREKEA